MSGTGDRDRGTTLIELLVVISIIGVLLGLGIAVMSQTSKDLGLRGAVGQVNTILRFARATAINERAPCQVEVDPANKRLVCIVKRTMGLWHFEDLKPDGTSTGAFGRDAKVTAGETAAGRFGSGLAFGKRGGQVNCGDLQMFTSDQGLELEAWIFQTQRAEQVLLEKKGEYSISIDKTGVPSAQVGSLKATAKGHPIPLNYWCHLLVRYDGDDVTIRTNDHRIGYVKGHVELGSSGSPLTIGTSAAPCLGLIDEVRVSALIASPQQEFRLPDHVSIYIGDAPELKDVPEGEEQPMPPSPQKPQKIYFDGMGRLDPERHPGPFRMTVVSASESAKITVTPLGTLE